MKRQSVKRRLALISACALALSLTACGSEVTTPETDTQGNPWSEDWTQLWDLLGVEDPGNGFVLNDNNTALAIKGILYASWVAGDSEEYVNEDEETVALYDAQIYLLVQGGESEEDAASTLEEWMEIEREQYSVTSESTYSAGGQEYSLIFYDTVNEDNPYACGASAFTTFGVYAVYAELTCREEDFCDRQTVLQEYLDGVHYSGLYAVE